MTPQELVTAAQAGDRDAFGQLWQMYRGEVAAVIYRRTHDKHLTEDLTSETFLRAWRRLPTFTWQGKGFAGWVVTIAGNLVRDHYGAAQQRRASHFPLDDTDNWTTTPSQDRRTNPEDVAEHDDLARVLDAAIADLTDDQRQVVALRFGAQMSLPEAAAAMGRRSTAVKSVQWRALQALKADSDLAALAVAA